MTTPMPEGGGGGLLGNLLGGITGGLAGANPLQSSVDRLDRSVNRLIGIMSTMSYGGGNQFNAGASGGGGIPVGSAGNRMAASFGGGGPGGTGNVRPPMPFGRIGAGLAGASMLGGAFAGYGQQQMPFQLGLNAMASMSMMGTGRGMGQYSGFSTMIGNQVVNPISSSPMDALALAQQLQFLAGTPRIMGSALGRAGFGASAAFGLTNPTLSGAAAGSLAQQIYNPMLSMRMRLLGYGTTPRTMGTGMPASIGNISASLIRGWYGANKVSPSQLMRTLSFGGKGYANLQYLGLDPQQMAPLLEGFNKLFNAGYSPQAASQLFSRAASNNPAVARQAQQALTNAGVTSVSSDIQKLRNNQSQQTQRSVNTAAGFNAALTTTTDSLMKFNAALNSILNATGMNGPLGALSGFSGVLAGTNHGNFLSGLGGLGLIGLAARMGAGGAAGGGALGGLGGAGGLLGRLGLGGVAGLTGALGAGAAIYGVNNIHVGHKTLWQAGDPVAGHRTGWNSWSGLGRNIGNWWDNIFSGGGGTSLGSGSRFDMPNVGGGATTAPGAASRQQGSQKSTMSGGISSAAVKAVNAAESQLGVPYHWGGETPGVGFDCSGLVQWAYKQAGVNLPRTSQQQWASLRRKAIPTNQAQEGDLVFMAGSDGTPNNPGHVGMMINSRQLIEAPTTGQNVKIIGFDPRQWTHAARPSGRGSLGVSNTLPGQNSGASTSAGLYGNTGIGMGVGNYGSANEVDIIGSMASAGMGFTGAMLGGMGLFAANAGSPNSVVTGKAGLGGSTSVPKSLHGLQAVAMQLLNAKHWGNQFGALNNIINRESGWRVNAQNPTSGAYGIPQALPGSKMAVAGSDWRTNGATQLRWMIDDYIGPRYGSPNNAWAFWQRNGWYSTGGMNLPSGYKWVGERGPELMFTGGGSNILSNAQSAALMKAATTSPQQSPWQVVSNQMKYGGQVITPGQMGTSAGGRINLTFGQNAICVTVNSGSTGQSGSSSADSQSIGKATAKAIVSHLENELLISTIAQGIKD